MQQRDRLALVGSATSYEPLPNEIEQIAEQRNRAHSQRRLYYNGEAEVDDEEILELILLRLLPSAEVKSVAFRLIKRFGDLNHILAASTDRLKEVIGVNSVIADYLKVIEATGHRMTKSKVMFRPIINNWQNLLTYLNTALAYAETERIRILYLDKKNVLIADEELGRGTIDHVPIYPREVVRRALTFNASALIMAHNHPSGDPHPSDEDISMTYSIMAAIGTIGLTLHDHIIIGKGSYYSFRDEGII